MTQIFSITGTVVGEPTKGSVGDSTVWNFIIKDTEYKGKGADGKSRLESYFVNCAAWNRFDWLEPYMVNGTNLTVTGMVSAGKPYQNKDGEWTSNLTVRVDNVSVNYDFRPASDPNSSAAIVARTASNGNSQPAPSRVVAKDDLPF